MIRPLRNQQSITNRLVTSGLSIQPLDHRLITLSTWYYHLQCRALRPPDCTSEQDKLHFLWPEQRSDRLNTNSFDFCLSHNIDPPTQYNKTVTPSIVIIDPLIARQEKMQRKIKYFFKHKNCSQLLAQSDPALETQKEKQFQVLQSSLLFFFISLSMSLTGLSLEMYIFHFEAISLSTHISGSKRPIFTNLDSLERSWPIDGS
jgi:hypothetical protein